METLKIAPNPSKARRRRINLSFIIYREKNIKTSILERILNSKRPIS